MIDHAISKLITYALRAGLIEPEETVWAVNTVLDVLKLDSYADPGQDWGEINLSAVLDELLDDAHARGFWPKTPLCTGICLTPSSWAV